MLHYVFSARANDARAETREGTRTHNEHYLTCSLSALMLLFWSDRSKAKAPPFERKLGALRNQVFFVPLSLMFLCDVRRFPLRVLAVSFSRPLPRSTLRVSHRSRPPLVTFSTRSCLTPADATLSKKRNRHKPRPKEKRSYPLRGHDRQSRSRHRGTVWEQGKKITVYTLFNIPILDTKTKNVC